MLRAAILPLFLSAALLTAADETPAPVSLRGSRPLVERVQAVPAAAGDMAPSTEEASQSTTEEPARDSPPVVLDNGAEKNESMAEGEVREGDWEPPASRGSRTGAAAADIAAMAAVAAMEGFPSSDASRDGPEEAVLMSGWHQGAFKMWGSGTGVESVTSGNARYYDAGMSAARNHCGAGGCALIVNPPGHRTVHQFHIHMVQYRSYGVTLKRKLERKVCTRSGWRSGDLPCGGKAAFFPGAPGIFSKAITGGSLQHASVIAWPASCGGRGTIVQLAYSCNMKRQIRGDHGYKLS